MTGLCVSMKAHGRLNETAQTKSQNQPPESVKKKLKKSSKFRLRLGNFSLFLTKFCYYKENIIVEYCLVVYCRCKSTWKEDLFFEKKKKTTIPLYFCHSQLNCSTGHSKINNYNIWFHYF